MTPEMIDRRDPPGASALWPALILRSRQAIPFA